MRAADGQNGSDEILKRGLSVDFEVGRNDNRIHKFAAVRCDNGESFEYSGGNLQTALKKLDRFADGASFLIGHNLIEFDIPHLAAADPELQILQLHCSDTLRLNPIVFPR